MQRFNGESTNLDPLKSSRRCGNRILRDRTPMASSESKTWLDLHQLRPLIDLITEDSFSLFFSSTSFHIFTVWLRVIIINSYWTIFFQNSNGSCGAGPDCTHSSLPVGFCDDFVFICPEITFMFRYELFRLTNQLFFSPQPLNEWKACKRLTAHAERTWLYKLGEPLVVVSNETKKTVFFFTFRIDVCEETFLFS